MTNPPKLFLIDGSSYIYRAFYAINRLTNAQGMPTNAVFGFLQMIRKILDQEKPDHMAMVFDAKGPTFRHEMFDAYKAHRPPMPDDLVIQLPFIKEISRCYGLPILEKEGVEADDIIATLAKEAEARGFEVVMVSGDKDLMQLISPHIRMWDTMKDQIFDLEKVRERFGSGPERIIDIMALAGDSSDNVPGVPGIGEKTAVKLIQTYGSLDHLLEESTAITPPKLKEKLLQNKEQALLSRTLVTLDTRVALELSLEDLAVRPKDQTRLRELFKELGFKKFLDDLGEDVLPRPALDYRGISEWEELVVFCREIKKAGRVSLDLETTSEDPMRAEVVGISLAFEEGRAVYVPVGHAYLGVPEQLPLEKVFGLLREILEDRTITKIGQNIKYEWIILRRYGLPYQGEAFDTMIASYLLNPSRRTHNLNQIAQDYLNRKMITYREVVGSGPKAKNFSEVPIDQAVTYSAEDAEVTLACRNKLLPLLEQEGLDDLFLKMEMPLVPVLAEMEMHGVRLDSEALARFSKEVENRLFHLEEQIYHLSGERFNINSSQQLGYILFEKLNLPQGKKTKGKTRFSTDAEVLKDLVPLHPLAAEVWNYRTLSKLKSTYIDALPKLVLARTGRLHTSFNQTITATGRLSSSEPNLQNIPVRTEEGRRIRQAFIPEQGWEMLSADYSQIELRILAHYSEDLTLVTAFQEGQDIHTRTAAELFHCLPAQVTPDMRRQAKVINFGILYGMSAFGLAKELGISNREAQDRIDQYFLRYQGVKQYIEDTLAETRRTRMVNTLFNRRRHIEDINSSNRAVRQFAERTAINTPIQGTAADLIKLAMIRIQEKLHQEKMASRMLLQVHDELVFEVPPGESALLKNLVRETMEGVLTLRVPLLVQISEGNNWADLK
ncbi:MAG: DNA polymerase I [Thermodesulfobacteriota bacterium]